MALDDLGSETWLQFGPYQWGYRYYSSIVELEGTYYQHNLMISYPADVEGGGVPVASSGKPFPAIFFQHAAGSAYNWYDYLFSRLASHGMMVVSMSHDMIDGSPTRHRELFLKTIDLIFQWNEEPDSYLYGAVDPEGVALSGHSHGGGAALMTMCEYAPMDPDGEYEIDCVSLLAPRPYADMSQYVTAYTGMPPLQVIYGSNDRYFYVAYGEAIAIYEPGGRPLAGRSP